MDPIVEREQVCEGRAFERNAGWLFRAHVPDFLLAVEANGELILRTALRHLSYLLCATLVLLTGEWPVAPVTAEPLPGLPADSARVVPGPLPDATVTVSTAEGERLAIQIYRPAGSPSAAVILIPDWGWSRVACWGVLIAELRDLGCEVLLPQWAPGVPISKPAPASRPAGDDLALLLRHGPLWLHSLRGQGELPVVAVAVGWSGAALARIAAADARVRGVAWIAPRRVPEAFAEIPAERPLELLLIAAEADLESSAVAMNLFARFNHLAELRLFGSDARSCALVQRPWVRDALREWIRQWSAR